MDPKHQTTSNIEHKTEFRRRPFMESECDSIGGRKDFINA